MVEPGPQITSSDKQVVFQIEADSDALTGLFKEIFCELTVAENGRDGAAADRGPEFCGSTRPEQRQRRRDKVKPVLSAIVIYSRRHPSYMPQNCEGRRSLLRVRFR